ncbi:MAG: hypothetical protein ACTSQO_00390 [Candidatus Helarchaeota archaeon]
MEKKSLNNFYTKNYSYLILIFIIAISFIYQLSLFLLYPYSYGVDGAYYDLNVKNILETGLMWSDDNPFVFYYFALWSMFLSNVTLGIKIGITTLCSLIPLPTFFIIRKITKNNIAALFGAFVSTFNPLLFRMMGDFVKNSVGVLFMLCFTYFFIITCEKKHSLKKSILYYGLSLLFLILTIFTHIYPTGFIVGFVFIYLIYSIIYSLVVFKKLPWSEIKIISFLTISAGCIILIGYFISPEYFDQFSKIYQFVNGLLHFSLRFPVFKQPPKEMPDIWLNPVIISILGIITISGIIIIVIDLIKKRKSPKYIQYIGFYLIIYFPIYLIVPNISKIPSPFPLPQNPIFDLLNLLTTFPVAAGISLICFEIYRNKNDKILNRIKGSIIAIFLMSTLLSLSFIPFEWRTRFEIMNFVPISLLIGYSLKKLNMGKKRLAAIFIIGFYSTSMIIQTNYFCFYSFQPILTHGGEEDLLYLKNYVESNSSLAGSIVLVQDLGIYYFTILITGLNAKKSGNPDELALEYNETIFEIIPNMGPHIFLPPDVKIIRNETYGQFIIILANETFHD